MKVGINVDIFNDDSHDRWLAIKHLLYMCMYRERHTLILEGGVPKGIESKLEPEHVQLLRFASVKHHNGAIGDCKIMNTGDVHSDLPYFSIDEGIKYLAQPLTVIMENNNNDAKFIDTLIECYNRVDLQKAMEERWLTYDNAGGCSNVPNLIRRMLTQYGGKSKFLRCYVILDSDAFYPGHINPNAEATREYLRENGIPHHVWEKRMMENYIPSEALPESPWKQAYVHMTPQQQDYYNIPDGFRKDEHFNRSRNIVTDRTCLLQEQATFYETVSDTNYAILYNGLELSNFKEAFPELYANRDNVNYETLQNRIAHQNNPYELEDVLNEIAHHLAM